MVSRLTIILSLFVFGYSALFFHLYELQLVKGHYYVARAESQYASGILRAERGLIYFTDKNGNHLPVVANKFLPTVYAVPKAVEDVSEVANRLAEILGRTIIDVKNQLSKRDDSYELLKKKAGADEAQKVEDAHMRGVYVEEVPERFYPFGPMAANTLGFVGPNSNDASESGHYGIEKFYDGFLAGRPGESKNNKITPATSGESLNVTIDPNIQIESEKVLENLVKKYNAIGGSVIVEDPKTGKILTIASVPNFDPNSYQNYDIGYFSNPTVEQIYEPGSVFKVITMSAGIDAGKITPDTTFYDTGSLTLNGHKIQNWDLKKHGLVTMTNVIEESLNTGAAFAERQTGNDIFKNYVTRFGFGEKTGVDLPGELRGDLRRLNPKSPAIAFATASFGQGVAVTQMELIAAISTIANGGVLMRPYVNSALEPQVIRRVISGATSEAVTKMMVSAVDKAGVAKINGYTIAGKSGTAQVPDFKRGGYSDQVIHTYVGFGPTKDPKFTILIKLNKPEGAPLAGTTVVPAFHDLAQFILNYYNIPPDRLVTK